MAATETVKIQHEGGFCIINKSDFDPKEHKLFTEKKAAPKAETPKAPARPAAKKTTAKK